MKWILPVAYYLSHKETYGYNLPKERKGRICLWNKNANSLSRWKIVKQHPTMWAWYIEPTKATKRDLEYWSSLKAKER